MAYARITIHGRVFKLRYRTEKPNGVVVAVCDTDQLSGEFGDEWPLTAGQDGSLEPAEDDSTLTQG